ncbi:hypothetical protein QCA50_009993 [Cerrena zonata]|uniref:Uncharacterized protein n=1 Tax=Cerrena zonata TaxID=2478898 RepID=A0AAW0G120_9APHY
MSDPINANPTIIDVTNLPTRLESGENAGKRVDKYQGMVDKVLSLSLLKPKHLSPVSISNEVPGLVSDVEMEDSTEDELSSDSGAIEEEEVDEAEEEDLIDSQEIFDLISTISDPEHPLTLAQLAVVNLSDISLKHDYSYHHALFISYINWFRNTGQTRKMFTAQIQNPDSH